MKLTGIYNHIRLDSGLVRRRSGGTSALSKRTTLDGEFLRNTDGKRSGKATSPFKIRTLVVHCTSEKKCNISHVVTDPAPGL